MFGKDNNVVNKIQVCKTYGVVNCQRLDFLSLLGDAVWCRPEDECKNVYIRLAKTYGTDISMFAKNVYSTACKFVT